ncbi:MAG: molybdopterin-dependent oxidoreductase [Ilumatobacteraceae bacterium]
MRRRTLIAGAVAVAAGGTSAALLLPTSSPTRRTSPAADPMPSPTVPGTRTGSSPGGTAGGTDATVPEALPAAADTVDLPDGVDLDPSTPYLTPNDSFFLIDTAWAIPEVDRDFWTLDIDGLVERTLTLTYADLLERRLVERIITIGCVSNEVGGPYIGTARWLGVPLRDILDEAGVADGATQVFSTSIDGWTCGFPVADALDGRDALIAIGMNGETLPPDHGFPARLVVPGLYGYVSATKWLRRITLTTWDDEGYWIPRGWSREAPVKTQSRIGLPVDGSTVAAGPGVIAGVAWAMPRGIDAVEVRIDDGPWQRADLGAEPTGDAWRQWRLDWTATPGEHLITVRATDGFGDVQTDDRSPVDPDGATGHHSVKVSVD